MAQIKVINYHDEQNLKHLTFAGNATTTKIKDQKNTKTWNSATEKKREVRK